MPDRLLRFLIAALFALLTTYSISPLAAQSTVSQPNTTYTDRADELLDILKGSGKEEEFFADSFLQAVPAQQFRAITAQLKSQYGEPIAIARIIPASELDGTVEISFERATLAMRMVIDRTAPYPVVGLLVTGAQMKDDGLSTIESEFDALPGSAGFEVAETVSGRTSVISAKSNFTQYAIGSVFKLYVLAELARSIEAGERTWGDVVPLSAKSLPSGIIQNWPDNSPMTLQTLATLMISISDNSATDTLINTLGREKIGKIVVATGHANPKKTLPILTTLEAFALKMPANDKLRVRYIEASDSKQSQLLASQRDKLTRENVNIANLATTPRHINQIEWFASPSDISKLLVTLGASADPVVKEILSINTVIPPGDAARWKYLGAKGGSEPGVVSFAFVAESQTGKNYAVSGSWNNPAAPVDEIRFLTLMNRLLNIIASR